MEAEWIENEEICREFICPAETTFQIIGGKWRPRILWELCQSEEPLRFSQIQAALEGITVKILTHHLRELEAMKLIERQEFNEFPPRVEYNLSDFGKSLKPIFDVTAQWLFQNQQQVRDIINDNPKKDWHIRQEFS